MWPFKKAKPSVHFKTRISAKEFRKIFKEQTGAALRCVDKDYAVADKKWYTKNVNNAYYKVTLMHKLWIWYPFHDCDDKSLIWKVVANALFAHDKAARKVAQSPACGIIHYTAGGNMGGGHAIDFALIDDKGKFRIVFIEPQNQTIKDLGKGEVSSIFFAYA